LNYAVLPDVFDLSLVAYLLERLLVRDRRRATLYGVLVDEARLKTVLVGVPPGYLTGLGSIVLSTMM
jgi:hypothetical protein